tara:strand:+ start:2835 stop:3812 length:978 start_codon:yes stop_codon:yes gene_type:complete
MNSIVAITIGDINGIGIKILIDLWKKNSLRNFILFTDIKVFKEYVKKNKLKININLVNNNNDDNIKFVKREFNIYSFDSVSLEDNTYKSLKYSYKYCKIKFCKGLITLPLRKDLIINKIDKKFIGHTEYFQKIDNKKMSNMILFHDKIIISTLTTHIPINKVSKIISKKNYLYNKIVNLHNTLKIDFNIKKPKLILSGLNPHAGENGKIGEEDLKVILPTIKRLKSQNINIIGPVPGDSMLINKNIKKYDCYIFIYHDQALIPFKYISQFSGVNYTGNLDIIRTSPDHGTAYNLVYSKKFSNKSLINCYKLINKISKNRKVNAKS